MSHINQLTKPSFSAYYEAQIKTKFFFRERKIRETSLTTFPTFLKGSLAEHQYLTILNCEYKRI